MISSIKLGIALVLGAALIILVLTQAVPDINNTTLSNQSIAFAANNTFYNIGHEIYTAAPYTPTLTYANGTLAVSNYTYTATQVRVGANIAPGTYYGHYTYFSKAEIGGTDYSWIVTVFVMIAGIAVILKLLGYI